MLARVSDNFKRYEGWGGDKEENPYEGTWDPMIRDIDPSFLLYSTTGYNEDKLIKNWWLPVGVPTWDFPNKEWVHKQDDLPQPQELLKILDENGEEWVVLEGHPEWAEPRSIGQEKWDTPHKRLWYQLRAYFIREEEYKDILDWLKAQDFTGRWMPKSSSISKVFNREFYWSPAYKCSENEYYEENEWREVYSRETGEYKGSVMVPSVDFSWSQSTDKSMNESVGFLKPSKSIFEQLKMRYDNLREGEYHSPDGLVCFAPSVYNNSKSFLLIKKEPLMAYLASQNLRIIWTVLGEKQIIGGRMTEKEYVGRLEISGTYYLNDHRLQGELQCVKG